MGTVVGLPCPMKSPGWLSRYSAVVCARAESGTIQSTMSTASTHAALRFVTLNGSGIGVLPHPVKRGSSECS
jgi:hypothetical protein